MMNRVARRFLRSPITRLVSIALTTVLIAGCSSIPRSLIPVQPMLLELNMVQSSFEGQNFEVTLLLSNRNDVDLPVREIDFDVRLGGEGLLQGTSVVPFTLPAQGEETLELEVFSEIVSSVSRLLSLASDGNTLNYELQGDLTLDAGIRDPMPLAARGQVPVLVNGNFPN